VTVVISDVPAPPGREQRLYLGIRRWRDQLVRPLASGLGHLRVPAWVVSALGVAAAASTVVTAPVSPRRALLGFGLALLADMVDGAVARRHGTASGRGKWIDHACDSATFLLLVAAATVSGHVARTVAAAAVVATSALQATAFAVAWHRDPRLFREQPRAGFFAHLPKIAFYLAFPLALAGGPDWVSPALLTTTALAILFLPAVALGLRR
jgi:phosphatidylglycerophosphate synthase